MTSGTRGRRRATALGTVVRLVLPLALIVPASVLFSMVWSGVAGDVDFAQAERHGVAYTQALVPLEIVLTNAESAAVAGTSVPRENLARAIDAVSAVDQQYGTELRTHDRWAELRTKISALPASGTNVQMFAAYSETTDLLLALMDKVRNESKLIRDPEADTYYLEDAAAQELPEGIVAAVRYTDRLVMAAGQSAADQQKSIVDITGSRSDVMSNAKDLSDDVRLAVEGTGSRSLGGALLSKLDRFNRSVDALVPLQVPAAGARLAVDTELVIRSRNEMQNAAADLSGTMLDQIDQALTARQSSLSGDRALAVVALVVAILLALVTPVLTVLDRLRRRPGTPAEPARGAAAPVAEPRRPQPVQPDPWRVEPEPAQWQEPVPSRGIAETNGHDSAHWERFGVSR
jgi:hypothetical protein